MNDEKIDKSCVTLPTACINSTLFSGIARTVKMNLMSPDRGNFVLLLNKAIY